MSLGTGLTTFFRRVRWISGAAVVALAATSCTPTPAGTLDGSFGAGGLATSPEAPTAPSAAVVKTDGKIVVAAGLTLTRYNSNGTLDTSFGTDGRKTIAPFAGDYSPEILNPSNGKWISVSYRTDEPD